MNILQSILKNGWKKGSDPFPVYLPLESEEETKECAELFAQHLQKGDVLCLKGDLGAGKTTFVKGLGRAFGIPEEAIFSPTFVLLNVYDPLAHFDLYRLQDKEAFLRKGFTEFLEAPYIACIEWPEPILDVLDTFYLVQLFHKEGQREVIITREKNE